MLFSHNFNNKILEFFFSCYFIMNICISMEITFKKTVSSNLSVPTVWFTSVSLHALISVSFSDIINYSKCILKCWYLSYQKHGEMLSNHKYYSKFLNILNRNHKNYKRIFCLASVTNLVAQIDKNDASISIHVKCA